jgi:hypothetical protein
MKTNKRKIVDSEDEHASSSDGDNAPIIESKSSNLKSVSKSKNKSGSTPPPSTENSDDSSSSDLSGEEGEGQVVKSSKEQREKTKKEKLISDILCRWWYVLPEWPPANFDYKAELDNRKLRLIESLDDWENAEDVDNKGFTKCYKLSQFVGVYRDAKGNLVDCRPNKGKPSFNNFNKMNEQQLTEVLKKSIAGQLAALQNHKGHTETDAEHKELVQKLHQKLRELK